jgi:hypothetical protein
MRAPELPGGNRSMNHRILIPATQAMSGIYVKSAPFEDARIPCMGQCIPPHDAASSRKRVASLGPAAESSCLKNTYASSQA